jgi:hypothetical protein
VTAFIRVHKGTIEVKKEIKKAGISFVMRRDWILLKFFNSMGFQEGEQARRESPSPHQSEGVKLQSTFRILCICLGQ